MRVVLGNVFYSKQVGFLAQSLSLCYIAAVLEQEGHEVHIVDGSFESLTFDQFVHRVLDLKPEVLGMALFEETLKQAVDTLAVLKARRPDLFVCVGGMFASQSFSKLLAEVPTIDAIVLFDGEYTMRSLVRALARGEDYSRLPGVASRVNGTIRHSLAPPIEDLDELPYPRRDHSPQSGVFTMIASRGCYGSCKFCSIYAFYKNARAPKIRVRDPYKVVDEIEYLYKTFDNKEIWFSDANFCAPNTLFAGWSRTVADEIIRRKIKIIFNILARSNDIDYDLFKRLKEAGLRTVFIGIESILQRVLDLFNKFNTVEDNVRAIQIMQKLKLNILIGYIQYDPFVTIDELRLHYDFFHNHHYYNYFPFDKPITRRNRLILYPGVPIYDLCAAEGLLQEGTFYGYRFKDARVDQMWNLLYKKWMTHPYFSQYPIGTMLRTFSHRGLVGKSFELAQIARIFTSQDMQLFDRLLRLYEERGDPPVRLLLETVQEARERVDVLVPRLDAIKDYVVRELGIPIESQDATLEHP